MINGVSYKNLFSPNAGNTNILSGINMIKEELELLLTFKKYGLFFGNNMGLGCEKYLFLGNKLATFNLVKADIEELFRKYTRATLLKTEVTFSSSTNTLIINLIVAVNSYRQKQFNMSFNLAV